MAVTAKPSTTIALVSGWVAFRGASFLIQKGDLFASDDPIVKKYPTFFGQQEVRSTVEAATAAPGEKR